MTGHPGSTVALLSSFFSYLIHKDNQHVMDGIHDHLPLESRTYIP
jgi:hypothetical protein